MRLFLTKYEASILLEALEVLESQPEHWEIHVGLKRRIQDCMDMQKPHKHRPT